MNSLVDTLSPNSATASALEDVENVRTALDATGMAEHLGRNWPYLRHRGLTISNCHVVRVHQRGIKGLVIEYKITVATRD